MPPNAPPAGDGQVPGHHDHRLGQVGALPAASAEAVCSSVAAPPNVSPQRARPANASQLQRAPSAQRQRRHGEQRQAGPGPSAAGAGRPARRPARFRHRGAAGYQQGRVHRGAQADLGEERRDIGVEDVVRQHPGDDHQQYRTHARRAQHPEQAQAPPGRLARKSGTLRSTQPTSAARSATTGRRPSASQSRPPSQVPSGTPSDKAPAAHRSMAYRQRPPLLLRRHQAPRVAGQQAPRRGRRRRRCRSAPAGSGGNPRKRRLGCCRRRRSAAPAAATPAPPPAPGQASPPAARPVANPQA